MNWELELNLHWPHDRFALGWQYIGEDEKEPLRSYILFLLVLTIEFHVTIED